MKKKNVDSIIQESWMVISFVINDKVKNRGTPPEST